MLRPRLPRLLAGAPRRRALCRGQGLHPHGCTLSIFADLRNRIDFALRQSLRFGRKVHTPLPSDLQWQDEARQFLALLDWSRITPKQRVLDVGARTFALAPVIEALCPGAHVTGIELDAYRRFADFTTRRDHGEYWASQIAHGRFFAMDVRAFNEPQDVVLLLDPFVSEDPLLAWGLPLSELAPAAIFAHCCKLAPTIVISNPTEDEARISDALLASQGMRETQRAQWPRRVLRCFSAET